ncbi:MAG: hypothetical protein HY002_07740 [Candidatus Rokubacteria bacterium]|nr:hypothetical protein [Candidatus Rokubacteria bacterium]
MLKRALETLGTVVGTLGYIAALVVLVGVVSHALTWLLTRKRAVEWVWNYWNVLGAALMLAGLAGIGYGWLVLGLETAAGSGLAGFGLLLASAGLWMIIPI